MTTPDLDRALLRMAARAARFGGWYADLETGMITFTSELVEQMGYLLEPSSSSPDGPDSLDGPEGDTAPQPGVSLLEQTGLADIVARFAGESFDYRRQVASADGEVHDIRVMGEAVLGDHGEPVAVQGALFDITELVVSERAHVSAEARLGATLDTMPDGVMLIDRDWIITHINPHGERMLQLPPGQLVGKMLWDNGPEYVDSVFGRAYRKAVDDQVVMRVREHVASVDMWIEAAAYPVVDGLAVYFHDVTDDEKSKTRLHESERKILAHAALLDLTHDAIVVIDLGGVIEYSNAGADAMFGWSRQAPVGRSLSEIFTGDVATFDVATSKVLSDRSWAGDLEHRREDGSTLILASRWTMIPQFLGARPSILAVSTDVTERRRLEREQLRVDRMESIGTLASGIAHDLNNVLTPILMAAQLLSRTELDPGRRALLTTLEASARRGADMVRQVVSFARGVDGRRELVDIGELIEETGQYARGLLPDSITTVIEIAPDLWSSVGDTTQLSQVLTNLVSNARDAMPAGGTLAIRAHNGTLADDHWTAAHLAAPGEYVKVEVEDSGHGMSDDVVSRIFEPFFTTKSTGLGTGLGLATSMGIVRSHGGYMQVYSEPGRGTQFAVYLPAADGAVAASTPETSRDLELPRAGQGELLLLVDDDLAIRSVVQESLESCGYRVMVASNGSEAIDVVENSPEPISLIITDVKMPVLDGAAAIRYFSERHTGIPVIAASGLVANESIARAASSDVRAFLPKPFTTNELLNAVNRALRSETEVEQT